MVHPPRRKARGGAYLTFQGLFGAGARPDWRRETAGVGARQRPAPTTIPDRHAAVASSAGPGSRTRRPLPRRPAVAVTDSRARGGRRPGPRVGAPVPGQWRRHLLLARPTAESGSGQWHDGGRARLGCGVSIPGADHGTITPCISRGWLDPGITCQHRTHSEGPPRPSDTRVAPTGVGRPGCTRR
jgi:hypothetical protein